MFKVLLDFSVTDLHRLLYLLALRPRFLQQLWGDISSASQTSLFGTPNPLLSVIARGLAMSEQDTTRIVPQLATFCCFFSVLISTLHDAEFYNDEDVMRKPITHLDLTHGAYRLIDVMC